jgi:hypothetical protein
MIAEAFIAAEIVDVILSFYGGVNSALDITRIIEKFVSNRDASKLTKAIADYANGELSEAELTPIIEGIPSDVWSKISDDAIKLLVNSNDIERSIWMRQLALAKVNGEVDEDEFCTLIGAIRELPLQLLMDAGRTARFNKTRNELLARYGILKMKIQNNEITYTNFSPVYRKFNQIRESVISDLKEKEFLNQLL